MRLLALLLLLSPAALAREAFPSDYKPSPCAQPGKACKSFPQSQLAEMAALRGFDIGQEWVDRHWADLTGAVQPACAKMATCFATPGNGYLFCNDVFSAEARTACDRFPVGSKDREKCGFFMTSYLFGIDLHSKAPAEEMQKCALRSKSAEERKLEYWLEQDAGSFRIYAIDAETRVPIHAHLKIQSKKPLFAPDAPDGLPGTFYRVEWKPLPVRVPNVAGHRDVVAPEVRIEAPGYRTETLRLQLTIPTMAVEMNPPPAKLKRGRNTVTITARDTATGVPVDARVMGGELILGKTNVPFQLELKKGQKRPEIWLTDLYDRYSDVVVAPAEK